MNSERVVLGFAEEILVELGFSGEEALKQIDGIRPLVYTNKRKEAARKLANAIRSLKEEGVLQD